MKWDAHSGNAKSSQDIDSQTWATEEDSPTTNVFMTNSSAKFGDNVHVKTEVILIPNQKLHSLPVVASQLIESKKLGTAETTNPPILQGGVPTRNLTKKVGICVGGVLILLTVAVALILFFQEDNSGDFVSRREWGAEPPRCPLEKLTAVPKLVIIHHTGDPDGPCTTSHGCINKLKSLQRYHKNIKKFCDIGYNFLIGGDGKIYEGRGYATEGAHTTSFNSLSLGFAFIGDFTDIHPPEEHLKLAQDFLENTAQRDYLTNNFKVCGRNQLNANLSPGKELSEDIKEWPRYTENPREWLNE